MLRELRPQRGVLKKAPQLLRIRADADRLRLSHILALKQLFREFPGKSKIEIQFDANNRKIGTLQIDSSWGVKPDRPFKDRLQEIAKEASFSWECG